MDYRPTVIERAFILAASGRVKSVNEIREALKKEGYVEAGQLSGPTLAKQLGKLIAAATGKPGLIGAAGRAAFLAKKRKPSQRA